MLKIFGKRKTYQIIFLNGAIEAWKQPQQLILIMQHLSIVDMVVAYEGFNEITFSRKFNYEFSLDTPVLGTYRKANLDKFQRYLCHFLKLFLILNQSTCVDARLAEKSAHLE